jgi:Ser/Thr protein kinase RdoA (MazF antagonist)
MEKETLPPDPLRSSPPSFTQDRIIEIARRCFGLTGVAVQLDSERDQNVRLTTPEGTFLLKISNPADGAAVLEMQTQAMLHVRRADPVLPVMQPLPTLEGDYVAVAADPSGVDHLVRLFTFLPGEMLPAALLGRDEMAAFGRVIARMGVALHDFSHPVAPYPILWDLRNTAALRPLTKSLDARRRTRITRLLDRF